jgi:MFS family permease
MWAAFSFHWTILGNNIIPTRVLEFATETTKGSLLGLVTVIGGLASMITAPIAGVLSDESRWRWGRRRPFLVLGVLLNAVALLALVGATTWTGFLFAVLAVRFFANLASGPYSALIPDQVHDEQKGRATGFAGFAEVFGRLVGAIAGGLLITLPAVAAAIGPFLFFAWPPLAASPMMPLALLTATVMLAAMVFTVWRIREAPPAWDHGRSRANLLRRAFTFDVRAESSFAWLLLARGFNMLGITTVVTFLLYYVRDYLGVHDVAEANAKLGYLFAASSVTTLPSAIGVGYLIDRYGRRKRWVYGASFGLAAVCLSFLTVSDYSQAVVLGALFGVCYGAYFTSDWALALTLLPRDGREAKYMGLWGVAGTLPEVLAPGAGGILLDTFNALRPNLGYQVVFCTVTAYVLLGAFLLVRVKEPARRPDLLIS